MVKPDLAGSIENQIFQLASSGRLRHQINDEELKQMLGQLQRPKKEFKINWKWREKKSVTKENEQENLRRKETAFEDEAAIVFRTHLGYRED